MKGQEAVEGEMFGCLYFDFTQPADVRDRLGSVLHLLVALWVAEAGDPLDARAKSRAGEAVQRGAL